MAKSRGKPRLFLMMTCSRASPAFDELLLRTKDKIFTYITYMVKDEDLANDLFQETFIKAIMKLRNNQYSTTGKFVFWITRIAHNVIIDHYVTITTDNIFANSVTINDTLRIDPSTSGHRRI